MLLLAGLMGMVAIGAGAFLGMSGDDDDLDGADDTLTDDPAPKPETAEGQSILDFATAADADGLQGDLAEDAVVQTDGIATPDETVSDAPVPSPLPAPQDEDITTGTDCADTLTGSDARDLIHGYAGDDLISGEAGNDQLLGGTGNDTLAGGDGHDTLHGGAGTDQLTGGQGDDHLFGHGGNDILSGEDGNDSLVGGEGDDSLDGGAGNDALHGDLGDDSLTAGPGQDTLFGGWGDDTLSGLNDQAGELDFLNGGGGDDLIFAGRGDIVTAGDGSDTVVLGDWLNQSHQAEILDFVPEEDTLLILYDDSTDADPDVGLEPDEGDPSLQHVTLNGIRIAAVNNAPGLSLAHLSLIGQSAFAAA